MPFRTLMEVTGSETINPAARARMDLSIITAHVIGLEFDAGRRAVLDGMGRPVMREGYGIPLREKRLPSIAALFRAFILEHAADIIARTVGVARSAEGCRGSAARRLAAPQSPPRAGHRQAITNRTRTDER
jgi:hypothetical protein